MVCLLNLGNILVHFINIYMYNVKSHQKQILVRLEWIIKFCDTFVWMDCSTSTCLGSKNCGTICPFSEIKIKILHLTWMQFLYSTGYWLIIFLSLDGRFPREGASRSCKHFNKIFFYLFIVLFVPFFDVTWVSKWDR